MHTHGHHTASSPFVVGRREFNPAPSPANSAGNRTSASYKFKKYSFGFRQNTNKFNNENDKAPRCATTRHRGGQEVETGAAGGRWHSRWHTLHHGNACKRKTTCNSKETAIQHPLLSPFHRPVSLSLSAHLPLPHFGIFSVPRPRLLPSTRVTQLDLSHPRPLL